LGVCFSGDRRTRRCAPAEARSRRGAPIACELEALRIAIMQGKAETALPEVETRLAKIATWWRQFHSAQPVPEAPDAEFLARAYVSALDIARDADFARNDWASALRRIDALLEVERALERPAQDIAATRMNRANVLGQLGRFGAAQAELEACITMLQNNPNWSAKLFSSIADLFARQGDIAQAITQQRRALAWKPGQPPRTRWLPIRPCRSAPPPTRRPGLSPRRWAGAAPQNLATQLRHPFPPRPSRRQRTGRAAHRRTARRPRL
jgi:tetratricopeptide (TPR) repeat protein